MENKEKIKNEKEEQQKIIQLSILVQELEQIEQKINIIEKNIEDLENLNLIMEEIKISKGKEIMTNLGKNIYIKTEIKDEDLLVDLGSGVVVKKTPEETKEIINTQLKYLKDAKGNMVEDMKKIGEVIESLRD